MADPGQVTQMTYNGYTIAQNRIQIVDGVDSPPYRVSESLLAGVRGAQYNQSLADKRAVVFEWLVYKPDLSSFLTERAAIFSAFNQENNDVARPLGITINGTTTYNINCVVDSIDIKSIGIGGVHSSQATSLHAAPYSTGWAQAKLIAYDPVVYSALTHSFSNIVVPGGGGATFALVFPITFTTQNTGTATVTNSGNLYDAPVLTLTNDLTNPVITNVTTGQSFQLTATTLVGDSVVIDMGARTVVKNGSSSMLTSITAGSSWWTLSPGANIIRINTANTGDGGTLQVSWNDVYNAIPGI